MQAKTLNFNTSTLNHIPNNMAVSLSAEDTDNGWHLYVMYNTFRDEGFLCIAGLGDRALIATDMLITRR